MLRKPQRHRRRRGGFTLMEVLLVVAILIILASLATFQITKAYSGARVNAAKLDIKTLTQTVDAYYLDIGSYPPTLDALMQAPDGLADVTRWHGPYLKGELPQDPWGGAYEYMVDGENVVIFSKGIDGAANTDDDVRNL